MTVEVKRIVDKFPTHYACFGEDSAFLLQAFNRAPVNTVLYNLLQDISNRSSLWLLRDLGNEE